MDVDFGGYGQDQCGPHYFDVSADVVYLYAEEIFKDVGPFTSQGVLGANRFLDPEVGVSEYKPGWRIAARYDIGALAVIEGTYMGIYDASFNQEVSSAVGFPNSLFTVFDGFGTGDLIQGFSLGANHQQTYKSDLQSTEISYRRYWVGNSPRVSGSWLIGARYVRFTEDLHFSGTGLVEGLQQSASRLWRGTNDLVGAQLGGDGWICLRQGLRVGGEAKAGIYNNRFEFLHVGVFPDAGADPAFPDPQDDFNVYTEGNETSFVTEASVTMVADILPSWSLKGGYQVLYLNSLANVGASINTGDIASVFVNTQGDALYHGFFGGTEYVW